VGELGVREIMHTHLHLTGEQISNLRACIYSYASIMFVALLLFIFALKNGYPSIIKSWSRREAPLKYWIHVTSYVIIFALFGRELYKLFPYFHDVFP
jgi:hypothetical protein